MESKHELLNTEQAALFLGVTSRHVSNLCRKGKIKCTRPGRDWFMKLSDLEAYKVQPKDKGGRPKKISEYPPIY